MPDQPTFHMQLLVRGPRRFNEIVARCDINDLRRTLHMEHPDYTVVEARLEVEQGGAMNERELDLFDAFKAGFEASGEGFNGEYVGDRFCARDGVESPAFTERMLKDFTEWRNADR